MVYGLLFGKDSEKIKKDGKVPPVVVALLALSSPNCVQALLHIADFTGCEKWLI
jgi:hypothetical protein